MKKLSLILISALLCLALLAGTSLAEELEKYQTDVYYGNMENPYGPVHAGMISVDIVSEEQSLGTIAVYVPESSHPCVDELVVLAPNGVTAAELAAAAQWNKVADDEEFCVVYAGAPAGDWNLDDPAGDIEFIRVALENYVANKLFVDPNERATYVVGYGEGGTMANELAMAYPSRFAGIVSIGGSAVSDEYMAQTGDAPSFAYAMTNYNGPFEQWPNKTFPVPAWIIGCGEEGANPNVAEYWKAANKAVDEGLTNAYGQVFQASRLTTDQLNNEQPIAEVWVSEKADALTYDEAFNREIWTKFLSRVRRFVGDPGNSLRAAFEPEDVGMQRVTIEVDGLERLFYIYAPTDYDGSQALPLVVCIHGYSSTARAFTTDTEWWRVAEARGLICAFVQAYPHEGYPEFAGNVPHWITNNSRLALGNGPEEQEQADLDFISAVLDYVGENYNVDATRRYVTGHSNGGMMTCNVIDKLTAPFAAAAPVGGLDVAWGNDPEVFDASTRIAIYGLCGDNDYFGSTLEGNDALAAQMLKWCHINGLEGEPTVLANGRYDTRTFYAGSAPLVKFSMIKNSPHAYFPEIAWKVWDECFAHYTRGEDGKLYYEGQLVG